MRVVPHVRRTTETGEPSLGHGRGVGVCVELERRPDEHVDRVLARELAQHAIRPQAAIASCEVDVRSGRDVALHAGLATERMDRLDPSRLDRRDQRRVRVERPPLADLAPEAELLPVGRQDQLYGGRIEANPMVQLLHSVALVDPADREHRLQNLDVADMAWIAREQRLHVKRPVGLHDHIDPTTRNVDARHLVDDLVHLRDDHSVAERGGLGDRRRVLGVRAREEIPLAVGLRPAQEDHAGNQVDEHPGIELDVGVNGADFDGPVADHLGHPNALRAGEGQIELAGDAALEEVEVLRQADRRDQHVQVMDHRRIHRRERPGEEIRLLLVVSLEGDAVTRSQERLQSLDGFGRVEDDPVHEWRDRPHAFLLGLSAGLPVPHRFRTVPSHARSDDGEEPARDLADHPPHTPIAVQLPPNVAPAFCVDERRSDAGAGLPSCRLRRHASTEVIAAASRRRKHLPTPPAGMPKSGEQHAHSCPHHRRKCCAGR